jgi:hypothetical protein
MYLARGCGRPLSGISRIGHIRNRDIADRTRKPPKFGPVFEAAAGESSAVAAMSS